MEGPRTEERRVKILLKLSVPQTCKQKVQRQKAEVEHKNWTLWNPRGDLYCH